MFNIISINITTTATIINIFIIMKNFKVNEIEGDYSIINYMNNLTNS